MTLTLHSPAFDHEGPIPRRYGCEGEDISPALEWTGVPDGTRSLALIVDDPDAPDPAAPRMTFVHCVLFNLPAATAGLPEACTARQLPSEAGEGLNDWQRAGYGGPCPPTGRHRYFFKLYALDRRLEGLEEPTKEELLQAMEGTVIARADLMGTYEKED